MPLFKRKPFEKEQLDDQVLKDNQEVFYCELSKEIFVNYEEYFERTMLFNSTIWTCALSGRPNLTYAEALESEKKHRKMIEAFPQVLKGPVVFIANLTKRSAISDLVDDVFNYVNTRFFRGEKVVAKEDNTEQYVDCEVIGFVTSTHTNENSPNNGKVGADDVKYRVKRLDDGKKSPAVWTATAEHIRRKKKDNSFPFSKDKLKLFLKQCIEYNDIRMLTIKQDAYKKYVAEANITAMSSFFVGKQPIFNLSKALADKNEKDKKKKIEQKKVEKKKAKALEKSANGTEKPVNGKAKKTPAAPKEKGKKPGKQSSLDSFVTKDGEKIEHLKKMKKLEEEEIKRQKELEAERQKLLAEERKKQMAEMNLLVQATVKTMNALKDDLELQDQKPMPVAKPIQTLIPEKYFADVIMVQEFIYSYTDILEDKDKFRNGIDLSTMERALLTREVAGPLSDILQVLLGSIFAFQIEESNEINIAFEKGTLVFKENIPLEQQEFIRQATVAANWPQKYLSSNMSDLPIDATTLTELLRIHFLTSGARLNEAGTKYRFQERGGFQNADDPGVAFCMKNKHVLHSLQKKTVYELSIDNIVSILKCLVNQILSYSTVRDIVEERMEKATKSRIALRNLYSAERKREVTLVAEKKEVLEEVKKAMETFEGTDEEKAAHKESLDKKANIRVMQLEAVSDREKKKFNDQMEEIKREIFAYQLYLGSDRAYRSYWLFESLPGLFIEHDPFGGECFENPVENIHGLANCAPEKRYLFIKKMLQEKQNNNINDKDKENKINNGLDVKVKPVDPSKSSIDQQQPAEAVPVEEQPVEINYSQRDLFMCTGNNKTCPVHGGSDTVQKSWSVLYTDEEINALIDSLNPRGIREKNLREQLELQKDLILDHIRACPIDKLQVDAATRDEKVEQIANDKTRAYLNANFNYPKGTNISEIMLSEIRKSILDMDFKLASGQLNQLRIKNRIDWREAIENGAYQMQEKFLQWGPFGQFIEDANGQVKKLQVNGKAPSKKLTNGHATENGMDVEDEQSNEENEEEEETKVLENISYEDPGQKFEQIENGIDDDGADTATTPQYKKQIHDLACALLQLSQSIDTKYFKPPFGNLKSGGRNGTKDQNAIKAKKNLEMWQVSLMNCKNASQLFLHYNVLYDSIKWTRSAQNAKCVCRSSKDPDKLLLCDGCNVGRHIYCLKPKLTKVPEGDWYCSRCKPNEIAPKKKRKTFVYSEDENEDDDDEDEEEDTVAEEESDDDSDNGSALESLFSDSQSQDTSDTERKVCVRCNKNGRNMFSCAKCRRYYDTKCLGMRSKPDAKWTCSKCTTDSQRNKRRRTAAQESDSDDDAYVSKSNKMNGDERRSSRRRTEPSPPTQRVSSSRRRGGAGSDDLLLDNVLIHRLFDEIAKHPCAWPFMRPVKTQDAPDYYRVIKQPMDMGRIKSNLNMGKYTSNYEVMKDIQLVFNNCIQYNKTESGVYSDGVKLETFIMNKCRDFNLPYTPSQMAGSVNAGDEPASKRKRK